MRLRDVMTNEVVTIRPEAALMEAAAKMRTHDVGSLPVCGGPGHAAVLGVITDRDITVRAVAEGRDPRTASVSEFMSSGLVFCYEDQNTMEAAQVMEQNQVRRLPVLGRDRTLVGFVSLADLALDGEDGEVAEHALEVICRPTRHAGHFAAQSRPLE